MDNTKKKASIASGYASAQEALRWLDSGGRSQVQEAVRKALEQTQARNKARELEPDFLERRVTF